MILFKDWIITNTDAVIARQHDNLSRSLVVTGDLPEGWDWYLLVSANGQFDAVLLAPMDGGFGVTLTDAQLAYSGLYSMQVRGVNGDIVKHTNVLSNILIPASLSGDGNWPEVPSEFTQLEARMREIAAHPPVPGDSGCWRLWDPETGSYADSQFQLPEGGGGADGADGITPTIGDNGNWYLGDTDTGKPSRGESGPAGADGKDGATGPQGPQGEKGDTGPAGPAGEDGQPGADGKSAYKYAKEGGYAGTEEEFAEKLAKEMPDKLPNPNALTFAGAVTGIYDGSAPVTVNIPSGGGGGADTEWEAIIDTTLEESAALNTGEMPGKTEMVFLFATPKCDANLSLSASSKTFGATLNGFVIGSGTYGKIGCIYCMKINGHGIPFIGSSDTTSTTPDIGYSPRTGTPMNLGNPTPSADDIPLKLTSALPIGTKIKVFVR